MRTAEEFRQHRVDTLPLALQRPAFFCGHGQSADLYYSMILDDLCWLDERETDFEVVVRELLHGSMRVYGQFFFQHLTIPDGFSNEIASTYAQAAFRLGYYSPERLLSVGEFEQLNRSIDDTFMITDHTESEIVSRFGKPTHEVLGGQTTVHCYGCCDPHTSWLYFDYSRCDPPADLLSYDWFDDSKLRDIRRENNAMELLPYGSWCRAQKAG
jgi:hypothetical protein